MQEVVFTETKVDAGLSGMILLSNRAGNIMLYDWQHSCRMSLFAWRTDVRRLLEREETLYGKGEEKVQNILFPCHNGWFLCPAARGTTGRIWRASICELLFENQVQKWHCFASQETKCGTVGYEKVICPCFQGCLSTLKCSNTWESSPVISHVSSQQWQ